jgi:hypothetical protein
VDSPAPVNRPPVNRPPVNRRPMNRRTALKRAGALAVALGALEAVGPVSFAPQRVGASIVPSDIQFGISAFLAVPPQDYGTGVQFQLPAELPGARAPPPRLPAGRTSLTETRSPG